MGSALLKVWVGEYEWATWDFPLPSDDGQKPPDKVKLAAVRRTPLCLAWAMTIHKAQGLEFECILTDIRRCFMPGHVYVALARVRSSSGLFLASCPSSRTLKCDKSVRTYSRYKCTRVH